VKQWGISLLPRLMAASGKSLSDVKHAYLTADQTEACTRRQQTVAGLSAQREHAALLEAENALEHDS
jgi:hypothetical protein